jgi:hypothetical protein
LSIPSPRAGKMPRLKEAAICPETSDLSAMGSCAGRRPPDLAVVLCKW